MRPEFLLRSSEGGKLKGNGDERKASEDTISEARSYPSFRLAIASLSSYPGSPAVDNRKDQKCGKRPVDGKVWN